MCERERERGGGERSPSVIVLNICKILFGVLRCLPDTFFTFSVIFGCMGVVTYFTHIFCEITRFFANYDVIAVFLAFFPRDILRSSHKVGDCDPDKNVVVTLHPKQINFHMV